MKFPKFPPQAKDASRFGGQKGYLLGAISKELQARGLTKDQIENGGLRIVTTLDAQAQASAESAVKTEFPKTANKGLRVGLTAVEPGTGRILAMYGGKDFLGKDKYAQVNAATYPIQPGSQMKVFALAAALEHGDTLATRYSSKSPLRLPGTTNGKPNSVRNEFNRSYKPGTQDLMFGLQESINTVFVDLALKHGPAPIRDAMVRAGIPDNAPGLINNALIPLGIASLTPVQVANAYATLCSGGTGPRRTSSSRCTAPTAGRCPRSTKIAKPQQRACSTRPWSPTCCGRWRTSWPGAPGRGPGPWIGRSPARPVPTRTSPRGSPAAPRRWRRRWITSRLTAPNPSTGPAACPPSSAARTRRRPGRRS